jgi:hypothetical protein
MSRPDPKHGDCDAARLPDGLAANKVPAQSRRSTTWPLTWESDQELDEFLAFVRRERNANLA